MQLIRKLALAVDSLFETVALLGLTSMILVVTTQVMTRKLLNFVFFWSEEVTLLLLVWFSFMGMAVGFREGLHMGIDSFTGFLPDKFNKALDTVIEVCILFFGLYLMYYGWEFTLLMHESTLPATKLPNSLLYLCMPVTGMMVCVYSALHLAGVDTRRHKGADVEMGFGLEGNK